MPTFEHVRETIERRSATAAGSEELVAESAAGRERAEREGEGAEGECTSHDLDARSAVSGAIRG